MWRSKRFPRGCSSDPRVFGNSLRSEVLVCLQWLEGSLDGPMLSIWTPGWRAIDELAELSDHAHGFLVEVTVTHDCILGQEVPDELVGACTTCNSLVDQEDQVIPSHLVQLEEVADVLPVLEGLFVRTPLHDGPIVRCENEDLGPLLPLEVLVARMADLLEHPEAVERHVFDGSIPVHSRGTRQVHSRVTRVTQVANTA